MPSPPTIGEPAPWFRAPVLDGRRDYAFDAAAGRWIVLLFLGSAAPDASRAALRLVDAHRALFDDERAAFFGVTVDHDDVARGRIAQRLPGIRWFLDHDLRVSTRYGAIARRGGRGGDDARITYTSHWLLLDPMLRVRARAPLTGGAALFDELKRGLVPPIGLPAAPVLIVPDILPRDLCRRLIETYERAGGAESGFMRDEGGVTIKVVDQDHKRRADHVVTDGTLLAALRMRMSLALRPMILRAFQFDATRIERFVVARYDGASGGHFRAHRDNTTKGTAHRKFACTINLNAEDYDGGDLCFPEFGAHAYRAPTGGAVVFSCSLLHEARPVTRGRRYAFLPFLYDDAGARLRERNLPFVGAEFQDYRSGLPAEDTPGMV